MCATVDWWFTIVDARIEFKHIYSQYLLVNRLRVANVKLMTIKY